MNLQELQSNYMQELQSLRQLQLQPPSTWRDTVDDFRRETAADKAVQSLEANELCSCFAEVVALSPSVLDEDFFGKDLRQTLQSAVAGYLQDQTFASNV